ncbi:hypothetical protein ACIRF8_31730 [Streptomyces sp. NPDC102406]
MTEPVQVPPYPVGGAGIFDVDPDQSGVSQSPEAIVTGDVQVLTEDVEV